MFWLLKYLGLLGVFQNSYQISGTWQNQEPWVDQKTVIRELIFLVRSPRYCVYITRIENKKFLIYFYKVEVPATVTTFVLNYSKTFDQISLHIYAFLKFI